MNSMLHRVLAMFATIIVAIGMLAEPSAAQKIGLLRMRIPIRFITQVR